MLQLKPDVGEVRQMLDHRDSPFIRAVGALLTAPCTRHLPCFPCMHACLLWACLLWACCCGPAAVGLPASCSPFPSPTLKYLPANLEACLEPSLNPSLNPCPCPPCPARACLQIGFLYLRYVCDPRKLWDWTRHYMQDDEVRTAWLYRPTVPPPRTACSMPDGLSMPWGEAVCSADVMSVHESKLLLSMCPACSMALLTALVTNACRPCLLPVLSPAAPGRTAAGV
jgi:hypothetical protein